MAPGPEAPVASLTLPRAGGDVRPAGGSRRVSSSQPAAPQLLASIRDFGRDKLRATSGLQSPPPISPLAKTAGGGLASAIERAILSKRPAFQAPESDEEDSDDEFDIDEADDDDDEC